ncbi:MAG TPA: acyltransferase [Gemmatimonadales bacterium]|nr:acyltransferase [Gemmatimonadales bacterium]
MWELAKGWYYKISYPLRGVRFEAGRNFRVEGRLIVRGPGRVIFGDDVRVGMTVTPWTYSPEAVIEIGDGTLLNGTRFGCQRSIVVGPRGILADARIMDTDFHSVHPDRHSPTAPVRVRPVILEENVWVCAQAGLLPGTIIGRNSVVAFGSVCSGVYPADSLIAGNPAQVVKSISEPGHAAAEAATIRSYHPAQLS